MKDGLRFKSIDIEHFKGITKRTLEIDGRSLLIFGKNKTFKSSFIQALLSPLDIKVRPSVPIQEGEERATIIMKLSGLQRGVEEEYTCELYFSPKNQKGRLVLLNKLGEEVKTPSTFLSSLIGDISFDIFEFLNQPKSEKISTLKKLSGKAKEIDIIDMQITEKKDARKYKKQRSEELSSVVKNHGYTDEQIELYSTVIDIEPLQQEMAVVSKSIEDYARIEGKKREFEASLKAFDASIESTISEIEKYELDIIRIKNMIAEKNENLLECKDKILNTVANIEKAETWLSKNTKPSAEEISSRINKAIEHNGHAENINKFAMQQREVIKSKDELGGIETEIKALEEQKKDIIKKSQLPVEGLSFTDSEIFIDNLPLEAEQINKARLIDIGVDISIALNPTLKTIFLHDGSLLDKESLHGIIKKCETNGFQVIVELVSESDEMDIKFVEEDV